MEKEAFNIKRSKKASVNTKKETNIRKSVIPNVEISRRTNKRTNKISMETAAIRMQEVLVNKRKSNKAKHIEISCISQNIEESDEIRIRGEFPLDREQLKMDGFNH